MQINNSNIYAYNAFGLNIQSSILIPEFCKMPPNRQTTQVKNACHTRTDVWIRWGNVPVELNCAEKIGVRFQATSNEFLLTVDNIARYHVVQGKTITISPCPGVEEREVRLFLLGSVFGALFHQKGLFPLHGSAVEVEDGCVVFCGASGLGKSTTAGTMVKRGYGFHADDICVISLTGSGKDRTPVVLPAFPHLKLWENTLKKSGGDCSQYSRVKSNINKYSIPVPDQFTGIPLSLKKIYILTPHEKNDITIEPITGMDKLIILKQNTYRLNYINGMDTQRVFFKFAAEVANQVKVSRVLRPRHNYLVNELVDALEMDFKS